MNFQLMMHKCKDKWTIKMVINNTCKITLSERSLMEFWAAIMTKCFNSTGGFFTTVKNEGMTKITTAKIPKSFKTVSVGRQSHITKGLKLHSHFQ